MTDGLVPAAGYQAESRAWLAPRPRSASRALYASLGAMVLATVAISLYFGGAGDFWGPVNDLLVAATVLLLVPAVLSVRRVAGETAGSWLSALTVLALVGIVVMAAGQIALVVRLIDLQASFTTGTIGILPTLAWLGGTGVLALRTGTLARPVGWWAFTFVLAAIVTAVAIPLVSMDTPTLSLVFGGPLVVALIGWMVSLARDLGRRTA